MENFSLLHLSYVLRSHPSFSHTDESIKACVICSCINMHRRTNIGLLYTMRKLNIIYCCVTCSHLFLLSIFFFVPSPSDSLPPSCTWQPNSHRGARECMALCWPQLQRTVGESTTAVTQLEQLQLCQLAILNHVVNRDGLAQGA